MIAKSVLHLHDLSALSRVDLAAEQLASGLGVVFEGTWFLYESDRLWCNAIADGFNKPTEAEARDRIEQSRESLQRLVNAHPAIEHLVRRVPVLYAVVEDYGQGVAPLFCIVDGKFVFGSDAWHIWRRP